MAKLQEVDDTKHFCKRFILHGTTVHLQAAFDPAKKFSQMF